MLPGRAAAIACLLAASLVACGEDPSSNGTPTGAPPDGACEAPSRVVGDRCLEPGVQDDGCPAGTWLADDGRCTPAGVPSCAEGFIAEGGGCAPVLPESACSAGEMALPGETACRPVMPCGSGTWGDIPVDATTTYVDASFAGVSDGSAEAPFTTISEAVAAAPSGGLVAVAAGSYAEDVVVTLKPVRLWGVCPSEVELVGVGDYAALYIYGLNSPVEVRGLAITGAGIGLITMDVAEVIVDGLWIHDTARRGLEAEDTYGPATLTVRNTLVEATRLLGISVFGATALVEDTVVRGTESLGGSLGTGLAAFPGPDSGARGDLTARRVLVEGNTSSGVSVGGSDGLFEEIVVRDTRSNQLELGVGFTASASSQTGESAMVTLRRSVIAKSRNAGIANSGGPMQVEDTVVRDTRPIEADGTAGWGIAQFDKEDPALVPTLEVRRSLVESSHTAGIISFGGASVTVAGTVIRDTAPKAADGAFGRGIDVTDDEKTDAPPTLTVSGSEVADNPAINIFVAGAAATVTGTAIRGGGRGLHAQEQQELGTYAEVALSGSSISEASGFGVVAFDAGLTMTSTLVDTVVGEKEGAFGDGVNVTSYVQPARVDLSRSRIVNATRAGLSSFGSLAAIGTTALQCNGFDLDGEVFLELEPTFDNRGGNRCGCGDEVVECKAVSAGLEAPKAQGEAPEEAGG